MNPIREISIENEKIVKQATYPIWTEEDYDNQLDCTVALFEHYAELGYESFFVSQYEVIHSISEGREAVFKQFFIVNEEQQNTRTYRAILKSSKLSKKTIIRGAEELQVLHSKNISPAQADTEFLLAYSKNHISLHYHGQSYSLVDSHSYHQIEAELQQSVAA